MARKLRILLIEDSEDDATLLILSLRGGGFEVEYERVQTEAAMKRALLDRVWDIVLCDYSMPSFDAPGALRVLKASGVDLPFIIISGAIGEETAVESLKQGADDYVTKQNLKLLGRAIERSLVEAENRRQGRRMELALRESESRFRQVVESINEVFWIFDLSQGTIVYVSPAFERVWGWPCDDVEFASRCWEASIHLDDKTRLSPEGRSRLLRSEYDETYRIVRRDGALRWIRDRAFPTRDENGQVATIVGVAEDITERKNAEAMLHLQSAALEAAANSIMITDCHGIIQWANPAFCAGSGYLLDEVIGRNPRALVKSGQHDGEFYSRMWRTILGGRVWHGEVINRRKDGELCTDLMTITPVRDERQEITHFIAILQDVTQQKLMEKQLLHAQRVEAIGTLASGVAHDLNNILAPMLMVSGVLQRRIPDEEGRNLLTLVENQARRGADIVRQLLTFSRGLEGRRIVVQPKHLLIELGNMMRETFPKDLEQEVECREELWTLQADPTQLHQVLLNLCVNARDAMPSGGKLSVAAWNTRLAEGDGTLPPNLASGPYVVFAVADTGCGMSPEVQQKIFDPFFTTKPVGKGTGLGLSTALGIVRGHGGFIKVESTPGKGSTFSVYFPAVQAEKGTEEHAPQQTQVNGSRELILVVDDEENVRVITKMVLERRNYRVLTAVNGQDALSLYLMHRSEVSLVLTDLMMPVMNGLTLIRSLRVLDPNLRIVVMSGADTDARADDLAATGARHFLRKPYDDKEVLDMVRSVLAESQTLGGGPAAFSLSGSSV